MLQSFEEKNWLLKLIAILVTCKKPESSNNDANCFEKTLGHSRITRNWYVFNKQRYWYLQLKEGMWHEWKKDWKESIRRKYLLEKPIHFSVKDAANNADTWGFI